MTYQTEFPDFDPTTMPAILASWTDTSYGNDACPSFAPADDWRVFVDYADPAQREFAGVRFVVICDLNCTADLETDDWSEVLAFCERIAKPKIAACCGGIPRGARLAQCEHCTSPRWATEQVAS